MVSGAIVGTFVGSFLCLLTIAANNQNTARILRWGGGQRRLYQVAEELAVGQFWCSLNLIAASAIEGAEGGLFGAFLAAVVGVNWAARGSLRRSVLCWALVAGIVAWSLGALAGFDDGLGPASAILYGMPTALIAAAEGAAFGALLIVLARLLGKCLKLG
jgi:hypothetical protein